MLARETTLSVIDAAIPQNQLTKIAAYVRVSSNHQDQIHSFAAQQSYYQRLMAEKTDSVFAGIYADEGLTGLKADTRPAFQRMLLDCRLGKIDRILTKSVSRFSRNIEDLLSTVRMLKALNVSVYFEKEAIDTVDLSSEMMLSVFSVLAQDESLAISSNMQMGCRMRMKNGTYKQSVAPYGYRLEAGKLIPQKAEAAVVQRIFSMYLSGQGMQTIADKLTEDAIPTSMGKTVWRKTAIGAILKNERYIGDQLLQKRYTTKVLPLTLKKNRGERDMYYIEHTHEAIISRADFEAVKNLLEKRNAQKGGTRVYQKTYDRKVVCRACGSTFVRKYSKNKVYWICGNMNRQGNCKVSQISEMALNQAFIRLYEKLKNHSALILGQMVRDLNLHSLNKLKQNGEVAKIESEILSLNEQHRIINELKVNGIISATVFIAQQHDINTKLAALKKAKELHALDVEKHSPIGDTKVLIQALERHPKKLEQFDKRTFDLLVDTVQVGETDIVFTLINGLNCRETVIRGI